MEKAWVNIKIVFLFIFLAFNTTCRQNSKACEIYFKNLDVIKVRLENKKDLNLMEVYSAIIFFDHLTGIRSHSGGGFAGQFDPTQEDYTNWLNWFKKNKTKLYWDDKEQKVRVASLNNSSICESNEP